jgi:hypothetical protein
MNDLQKSIHGRKISQFLNYISNTPGYAQESTQNLRWKGYTLMTHFGIEDSNLVINIRATCDKDIFLLEFKYLSGYKIISFDLPDDINRIINSYGRSYLHVTFSIQYNKKHRAPTCTLYSLEHTIPNVYLNMVEHYTYLIHMYTSLKHVTFFKHVTSKKKITFYKNIGRNGIRYYTFDGPKSF